MGKTTRLTITLVIALIIFSSISFAEVIVFEDYQTSYKFEGGKLYVEKNLKLKNVGASPIIPGEIHFKLSEKKGDSSVPTKVDNFEIVDLRGQKLNSRQTSSDTETDLVFTIWNPLLPKFNYDFTMTYEIEFNPKGLLFYEITIPDEKTTIPIRSAVTRFLLPSSLHVTYAPDAEVEKESKQKVLEWKTHSNINFEYSILPLPKTGLRMVNIFWIFIILIFAVIFLLRAFKNRKE